MPAWKQQRRESSEVGGQGGAQIRMPQILASAVHADQRAEHLPQEERVDSRLVSMPSPPKVRSKAPDKATNRGGGGPAGLSCPQRGRDGERASGRVADERDACGVFTAFQQRLIRVRAVVHRRRVRVFGSHAVVHGQRPYPRPGDEGAGQGQRCLRRTASTPPWTSPARASSRTASSSPATRRRRCPTRTFTAVHRGAKGVLRMCSDACPFRRPLRC